MEAKILPMKRALRAALLVLLLSVAGMTKGYAYDFSAVCETGQTLYYNITDSINHYVGLTYPGTLSYYYYGYNGWGGFTEPTGDITLPSTVDYDGVTYTVTSIGDYAFAQCHGLTGQLVIPDSVISIGNYAFNNCYNLGNGDSGWNEPPVTPGEDPWEDEWDKSEGSTDDLIIGNSVTTIGDYAFAYCSGLTGSIVIPNSVISIGDYAFSGCSGFGELGAGGNTPPGGGPGVDPGEEEWDKSEGSADDIVIGNSVTSIGSSAFYGCSGLTGSLVIPSSVSSIGEGAFSGCSGLEQIIVEEDNPYFDSRENCNAIIETGTNTLIMGFQNSVIPNTVTTIGGLAFSNCFGLTSVNIPNSVTTIGDYAFSGCSGLTSITIPNSVTSIGNSTFLNCLSMTSITIPNTVTTIGSNAFSYSGLTSIVIPNSITTIGNYVFSSCYKMTNITIPNSVTTIGIAAFRDSGLTSVAIPNSVTTISNYAFENCNKLTSITIPDSVTSLGAHAFQSCSSLTSVTIGNSLSTIESYAFYDCWKLTNVTFGNSVTTIGEHAFHNCRALTSITIPNSVTSIEAYAFYYCKGLKSVTFGNSVAHIRSWSFYDCSGLTSLTSLAQNPPTLSGSFYSVFNINNMDTTIPVYVPCGSLSAYQTGGWHPFTNKIEMCSGEVAVTVVPSEGGIVTGAGYFEGGDTCTLSATPNPGYMFRKWTENGSVVSTDTVYTFPAHPTTIVANFCLEGNIVFADADVKALCVANWDTNGDGELSYAEAAEVNSLGEVFRDNTTILSFNELQYFVGLTTIDGWAFANCDLITSITIPGSITSIGDWAFHSCKKLASLTVLAETPPVLEGIHVFSRVKKHIPVYVPCGTLEAYTSITWGWFTNIHEGCTEIQTIPLAQGWNWVSTYIEQEGIDGLSLLENSIGIPRVRIESKDSGFVESSWSNGQVIWQGTLTSINNEEMYKIGTKTACTATMEGIATDPALHPITINRGWNWIGFPCSESVSVSEALSGFSPKKNDMIKGRNGSATYSNGTWSGTLNTLEPGQGYMYGSKSNATKTLVFQTGSRGNATQPNITPENNYYQPAEDYADNMTVIAVVELDGEELRSEDYELAVFAGDECRGSVKLMYVAPIDRYVAFLTVFGELEEELSFRLTDGFASSLSTDRLTYVVDNIAGTLDEPVALRFGATDVDENALANVSVYPNPSEGLFNIEGNGIRRIEVVNVYGQVILSKEVGDYSSQIDLGDNAAGIYLLRVVTDGGITTSQIVKR